MPKGLQRIYGQGHFHFLTFSCYRRLPLLSAKQARSLFVHALGKIRERYKISLVGYVVMPEHVHPLLSETAECTPSLILKVLKQRVSRDLGRRKRRAPAGQLHFAFSAGDCEHPMGQALFLVPQCAKPPFRHTKLPVPIDGVGMDAWFLLLPG